MRFLVTCGPTYEPLDKVRRLTNFSTGQMGIGLANFLHNAGHEVTLLKGYYSVATVPSHAKSITFTTTDDLLDRLREASHEYNAVFHAAAVSDFGFGKVYRRSASGQLETVNSGKFGTGDGGLLAELIPTRKIIAQLRELFPKATLFGWKYEVDGSRENAIQLAKRQIQENRTDYSVANGPAYGEGFGIVSRDALEHCPSVDNLYPALLRCAG